MMERDYHFHVSTHKSTNLIQELQLYNLISSQRTHFQRPSQSEFGFQPRDTNTESVAAPHLSLTLWDCLDSCRFFLRWLGIILWCSPQLRLWVHLKMNPGGSDGKEPACSARDPDFIPGSGISTTAGNDNPLQYSCLENSKDRGAWQVTVHGVTELDATNCFTYDLAWLN